MASTRPNRIEENFKDDGSRNGYRTPKPRFRSNTSPKHRELVEQDTCTDPFSRLKIEDGILDDRNIHQLSQEWTFWYLKPPIGSKSNASNYESLLKHIGGFNTIESFWAIYLSLKRPEELIQTGTTDYSIFKKGIRPVWEDKQNSDGGKLTLRLKKGGLISLRFWELSVLKLIGSDMDQDILDEINGIMFSIRHYEDIVSIWTKNAKDSNVIERLREVMRITYSLSSTVNLEYKAHHSTRDTKAYE
jgi:translation initiation factor 4E